jgi:glutathione S-transferase
MTQAHIPFREISIRLRQGDTRAQILRHSPSGHVPALIVATKDGRQTIWDSLAILEYLAETHPDAGFWPAAKDARAHARALTAEMHAGFQALRQHCPLDFVGRTPMSSVPDSVGTDVRRIVAMWIDCRRRYGAAGGFLFGPFSAADAMYAPIASRFRTYLPDLAVYGDDGTAQTYVETLFALPGMEKWEEGARTEQGTSVPAKN